MPQPNRHKESLLTHAEAMRLWHYDSATGRLYNRIFVNMTGLKGVRPNGKNWSASLRCRGVSRYLGTYAIPEIAHAAYAAAALEHHGEFARTE